MARYNKIYAGPVTEPTPQVRELPATADTLAGTFVSVNATATAFVAAAAGGAGGKVFVVQDNYLTLKGVDDPILATETLIGMEMLDEQLFNVRVPTGVSLVIGDPITVGASGKAAKATTAGNLVIAYAEETFNNNTGADQLVRVRAANGRVIAA